MGGQHSLPLFMITPAIALLSFSPRGSSEIISTVFLVDTIILAVTVIMLPYSCRAVWHACMRFRCLTEYDYIVPWEAFFLARFPLRG